MTARRATGIMGVLPVDKPEGMTSHDVVNVVRRVTGERRVGHAGTLDPSATGLLVVLLGPATRLAPYLTAAEKEYQARIVFGSETDTDDADGAVTRTDAVPAELSDESVAAAIVASLQGEHDQVPPAYSAVKTEGRAAYRIARAGGTAQLQPRRITVSEARLLSVEPGELPAWTLDLTVSKGTYIRALARDLGRSLGTAAHLAALRRTRSGAVTLAEAHDLAEIQCADPRTIRDLFADEIVALGVPAVDLSEVQAVAVSHGRSIPAEGFALPEGEEPVALARDGRLVAVYGRRGDALIPSVVFPDRTA